MGKKSGGVRIKQVGKPPSNAMAPMLAPPTLEDFMIPADEMIHLPPQPNKKYQVFFPIHETFTMKTDTFQIIYPNYFDATKTLQQGRRIPIHLINLGCDKVQDDDTSTLRQVSLSPTVQELSQALQSLGIRHVVQPYKGYSRDPTSLHENPGRCLVDIKSHFQNKYESLIAIVQRLHELPDRQRRIHERSIAIAQAQQLEQQQQSATNQLVVSTAKTTTNSVTMTTSSTKKKNKKKK
jgi:signal recognition particle subunit SEC65